MPRLVEFLIHGVCGAALAALIALSILWYFDSSSWIVVSIASGCGFLLGGFGGESTIEWLKEIWWWS